MARILLVLSLGLCSAAAASAASHQKAASAGRALYSSTGCAHCHGETLQGTEHGPNLQGVGRKLKSKEIQQQIEQGGGGMPPFDRVLAPDQISDLVAYLRTQRARHSSKAPPSAPQTAPAPQ